MKESVLALVLFEAARLRLGHATARPNEVKRIVAKDYRDLLLQYSDILNSAMEEEDAIEGGMKNAELYPRPVQPVVDVLNEVVSHTTCTGNTTISTCIGWDASMNYVYRGEENDDKIVVKELMSLSFSPWTKAPSNAAVLYLLTNGIFTVDEIASLSSHLFNNYKDLKEIWRGGEEIWSNPTLAEIGWAYKWAINEEGDYFVVGKYYDAILLKDKEDGSYCMVDLYPAVEEASYFVPKRGEDGTPFIKEFSREEAVEYIENYSFGMNEEEMEEVKGKMESA